MKFFVYSITVESSSDRSSFLKAFPSFVKLVDPNSGEEEEIRNRKVLFKNSDTISYCFLEEIEGENFKDLYRKLKQIVCRERLSCEYGKDGKVFLLPYYQLHSRNDVKDQRVIHNGIPKLKKEVKVRTNLCLRKEKEKDLGIFYYNLKESSSSSLITALSSKEWLDKWKDNYRVLKTENSLPCCCYNYQLDNYNFICAFLLTFNLYQYLTNPKERKKVYYFESFQISPEISFTLKELPYSYEALPEELQKQYNGTLVKGSKFFITSVENSIALEVFKNLLPTYIKLFLES